MKYLYALASIVACAAAIPQGTSINPGGPIQPCTYTTTSCTPLNTNSVETITVYEVPFPQTVTQSVDCHGCADVSVFTGCTFNPPPITSTTFVIEVQSTTTVDVCSPTP